MAMTRPPSGRDRSQRIATTIENKYSSELSLKNRDVDRLFRDPQTRSGSAPRIRRSRRPVSATAKEASSLRTKDWVNHNPPSKLGMTKYPSYSNLKTDAKGPETAIYDFDELCISGANNKSKSCRPQSASAIRPTMTDLKLLLPYDLRKRQMPTTVCDNSQHKLTPTHTLYLEAVEPAMQRQPKHIEQLLMTTGSKARRNRPSSAKIYVSNSDGGDDSLLKGTCVKYSTSGERSAGYVAPPPGECTTKKYSHPFYDRIKELKGWTCNHSGDRLLVRCVSGETIHSVPYKQNRSRSEVQDEIVELERLMKGLTTDWGTCTVVLYQNEINKLQADVKQTLAGRDYPQPQSDPSGLRKFCKEFDTAMEALRQRHKECMDELSNMEDVVKHMKKSRE